MALPFLLYGSYGYTGSLIAELAVRHGLQPILAGRDVQRLEAQAKQFGVDFRPIALDDRRALEVALEAVPGFQTPSLAYGPDFILEFDGVKRKDE